MGLCRISSTQRERDIATDGIRLVVRFDKVKDPRKFRDVMKTCMEETRKESGDSAAEDSFVLLEWWADAKALEAHMKAPHIQQLRGHMKELLAGNPDIRRYASLGI